MPGGGKESQQQKEKGVAEALREDGIVQANQRLFDSDLFAVLGKYAALEIKPTATGAEDIIFDSKKYQRSSNGDVVSVFASPGPICLPAESGRPTKEFFEKSFKNPLDLWKQEIEKKPGDLVDKTVELKFVLQDSKFAGVGHFTYMTISITPDKQITITNKDPLPTSTVDLRAIEDVVRRSFPNYQLNPSIQTSQGVQTDGVNCGFHVAKDVVREFTSGRQPTPLEAEMCNANNVPALRHAFVKMLCDQENSEHQKIITDKSATEDAKKKAQAELIDLDQLELQAGGAVVYQPVYAAKKATSPNVASMTASQPADAKVVENKLSDFFANASIDEIKKKLSEELPEGITLDEKSVRKTGNKIEADYFFDQNKGKIHSTLESKGNNVVAECKLKSGSVDEKTMFAIMAAQLKTVFKGNAIQIESITGGDPKVALSALFNCGFETVRIKTQSGYQEMKKSEFEARMQRESASSPVGGLTDNMSSAVNEEIAKQTKPHSQNAATFFNGLNDAKKTSGASPTNKPPTSNKPK